MEIVIANSNVEDGYKEWEKVRHLADTALKARLYVSGWSLSVFLKDMRQTPISSSIAICYNEDKAIGVCILVRGCLQVFVKKSYRRKGIGTMLVNALKSQANEVPIGNYGIHGSEHFWRSCNLEMEW